MLNGIAFIGGIHGVGKTTICKDICTNTGLIYLSASEVLKWEEINNDKTNKKVVDVNHTQDRLIKGLNLIVTQHHKYLLDGHYCLLNSDGAVKRVPIDTFKQINPFSLILIIGNIVNIKAALEARDNKFYDADLLNELQNSEINYAKELSDVLKLKLNIGTNEDISHIINAVKNTMP